MDATTERGVFTAVLEELEHSGLARLFEIKTRIESGGELNDFDMEFLIESVGKVRELEVYAEVHPRYQGLAARVVTLYHTITETALDNQRRAPTDMTDRSTG